MNDLFEEIQAFLQQEQEKSQEELTQEYKQLLAEFNQTRSYVERFKRAKREEK